MPGGMLTVVVQRGLLSVYCDEADKKIALVGSQLPNWGMEPTREMLSPHAVFLSSWKLTETCTQSALPF